LFVGIDFDNTIIRYDGLMHSIASGWGLISGASPKTKKEIRDTLRSVTDGETLWQRLQAEAYGQRILEASPAPGFEAFLAYCKRRRIPVCIVSHKTEFSNLGESHVNLRTSAMNWLRQHGLVGKNSAVEIGESAVFFEATRALKVARIGALGVTHFIDDLEETFEDPGFPAGVQKILYAEKALARDNNVRGFAAWNGILDYFERLTAVTPPSTETRD
jgi:hypothetical protein